MQIVDIHSHILPSLDDGAKTIEEALRLLSMMRDDGISDVFATPHFYSGKQDFEGFPEKYLKAKQELLAAIDGKDLPRIHFGCELHYFMGMGKSYTIKDFTLEKSKYLLLELPYNYDITDYVLKDITELSRRLDLIPILAHIERYSHLRGYKKLLKLIESGDALSHINASGVLSRDEGRLCKKLIKRGLVTFVATDSHSPDSRPPLLREAFKKIENELGKEYVDVLIQNAQKLMLEIEGSYGE